MDRAPRTCSGEQKDEGHTPNNAPKLLKLEANKENSKDALVHVDTSIENYAWAYNSQQHSSSRPALTPAGKVPKPRSLEQSSGNVQNGKATAFDHLVDVYPSKEII